MTITDVTGTSVLWSDEAGSRTVLMGVIEGDSLEWCRRSRDTVEWDVRAALGWTSRRLIPLPR